MQRCACLFFVICSLTIPLPAVPAAASAQVRATPPPGQITYAFCCRHPDGRALLMPRRCSGRMQSLPMERCKQRVCCFHPRGYFSFSDARRCESPVSDNHCRRVCCQGARGASFMAEGACIVTRGRIVANRLCEGGAPALNIPAPDVPGLRGQAGMRVCCRYPTAKGGWAFAFLPRDKCQAVRGAPAPDQSCRTP